MYLSSNDGTEDVNINDNSQIRQENRSSSMSNSPSPSLMPTLTLFVVDDTSTSDTSSLDITDTSSAKVTPSTDIQTTSATSNSLNHDNPDDTQRQRRRNSSIAKLLGGQPLKQQQYEEINQQIIENQVSSNQNGNSDNISDVPVQRSRSSITRTLLMNADRHINNPNATITTTTTTGTTPLSLSKDFEYLIRRELDIEHAPATLRRNTSTPSVFQNLSSARSTPPTTSPSPTPSKLKRKRTHPKHIIPTTATTNSTSMPLTMRDPFDIDSNSSPINCSSMSHPHQNSLYRFDARFRSVPSAHYQMSLSTPTSNSSAFNYHRLNNNNASACAQFKLQPDRIPITTSSSSVFNSYPYAASLDLTLPPTMSPISAHTSSLSLQLQSPSGMSSRKHKFLSNRPDLNETPIHRLQSSTSHQSNLSSSSVSSPSSSSGQSAPLKKRLLHAYENERQPSSYL